MLSLTRFAGESIVIEIPASSQPQTLEVQVTEIRGYESARVKLGFTADKSIKIFRKEIAEQKEGVA